MSIHTIEADFGSYEPRRNRPVTIGRDETLDLTVKWVTRGDPVNLAGGYATAWLVDADGVETQIPSAVTAAAGLQRITETAFTLERGRYTLIARLTLGGVTRRAQVDLTVERAIGTLIAPPLLAEGLADVTLTGGEDAPTVNAAAAISGATAWAISGAGVTIDAGGVIAFSTDLPILDETITVTGSNSAGSVEVEFLLNVVPVWILSGDEILMAPFPPAAPIVSFNQITG